MTARLTIVTSEHPAVLSKTVARGADGALVRSGGGVLVDGSARIAEVASLTGLKGLLEGLGPSQALTFGIPRGGDQKLLSRARFAQSTPAGKTTTRTRDQFTWPAGPGILMLDHDPDDQLLSREDLVGIIRTAAPGLADAAMLWWPSASSHICIEATGEDLTGLRGQRLYLMVADAADIPRAGAALVDRLWASGQGWIRVNVAGRALERCPVDASVWQPERLDFAAGAVCRDGLVQRRGSPFLIPGRIEMIDSRALLPDDASIARAATTARRRAKAAAADDLDAARTAYLDTRTEAMLASHARGDEDRRDAARRLVERAIDHEVLSGDFPVEVESAPGIFEAVTVAYILGNRAAFHGRLTRDPIEPDYDGGRAVGKLFLLDARPALHSFARHGRTFRLVAVPQRVEVARGRLIAATEQALVILGADPAIFDFGGQVALVDSEGMAILDEHALAYHLAGGIQFWQQRKSGNDLIEADIDPPPRLVRQILSLGTRRHLKPLSAVVTAPTIRPDGTILGVSGYDPQTALLVCLQHDIEVAPAPDRKDVEQALADLMYPFADFPLVDRFARGGLLAALLTAVVRPTLGTAPAFAMDAPVQGSGKTLLASCIAALATGRVPEIWPHTCGRDDEEVRKRLFAALRDGTNALIWDNITGIFDSAALASAITAPVLRDRVLGRSECLSIPNRALLLLTGNNLCPAGDLPRRLVIIRIDPGTDTPFAREFDLDPLDYVLAHRCDFARAALVLIRGWLSSGAIRTAGRTASFESWDDLVRQTVCWIDREIAPGEFGDPLELMQKAQGADPEQECLFALLEALSDVFGSRWFTAKEVCRSAVQARANCLADVGEQALAEALADIGGEKSLSSTKSTGRILKFREGRICYGLRLKSRSDRSGREYRVDAISDGPDCGFGGFGGFESGDRNSVPVASHKSEVRKSNPPNPPNPHATADGVSEDW